MNCVLRNTHESARSELAQLRPESAAASFEERISYLSQRRVKGIFGGLISMRRRSGKNWFCVEEMQKQPAGPIGDALHERFSPGYS